MWRALCGLGVGGGEGAHRLVDEDEALLRELQAVVGLEVFDIAAAEALAQAGAHFRWRQLRPGHHSSNRPLLNNPLSEG